MQLSEEIDTLARALLYEGYALYPYRPSSLKNRQRWTFGGVFPRGWARAHEGERSSIRAEVLVEGADPKIQIELRFLHLLQLDNWQQAIERRAQITPQKSELAFVPEPSAARQTSLRVKAEFELTSLGNGVHRASVQIENASVEIDPALSRDEAAMHSLASANLFFTVDGGQFVSLLEPRDELRQAASECCNEGVWPVLVGDSKLRRAMLASPITLYDFPRVAHESRGDLFDGTEIDEILSLRILSMTDAEKAEARDADPRVRELLDRTERLAEKEILGLHGARRDSSMAIGTRVVLRPRARADVFDLALAGKAATVVKLEQDFEGRDYVVVVIDDDPGADLGRDGHPGHRFFFGVDEVELT